MDRDVLACVLDTELPARIKTQPASLSGYRKVKLPHETYPLLVVDAHQDAQGVLIYGLSKEELNRIVYFEGEEYELVPCQSRSEAGVVEALFFDEGVMPPAQTEDWDFAYWQREHKPYLLRQSRVYMSYYGKMSAKEADIYWQNYSE